MRIYLDLLAREATAVEFEGPITKARTSGASAEELAELEEAKLAALRVRALLARRARREAELSALFDTAGDLAGLRDLDAVLQAIVRRARQLLGTDTSYMTLIDDERGDTYMRVTDGSISPAFQSLRLPLGAGLGGLVAQTASPYASATYQADARFRHTEWIDSAVGDEGLVGILGVPLKLGDRVIGVLFAADRSERSFGQEEVALLCSLAAHAAVAIDNTRLLHETRAALEELSAASEIARERNAAVERAGRAHDRMTDIVVRGGGVQDVAAVVTDILGGAVLVLDTDGQRLAEVGTPSGDAILAELSDGDGEPAVVANRARGRVTRRGPVWMAAIAAGKETFGTLFLRTDTELSDADERIVERAAVVTALLSLFRRSATEAEARVRGELLDDLVSGRIGDTDTLDSRARLLGVDLRTPHVLLSVPHNRSRERATFWAAGLARAAHGLSTAYHDEVLLLLPGDHPGEAARKAARELGQALGTPATVGAAGPIHLPTGAQTAHREARRCAEALTALGREGDGASSGELGFVGLLLGGGQDVQPFLTSALGPVIGYDSRRGTELATTLEAYYAAGKSPSKAADALHVHANTVAQRLERIGRLLGEDWQHPDNELELRLALKLYRLHHDT
ncbi:helix-turn-helix domain-containing protein [Stackebrandtia nassauensis]|uniref:Putative phytochrome sensor protein n=1 Tax=Stackebrandtia nassauensis (strain DSM 44728 / CIP 108903 / NRRL B-16338 / NBRC 102104 / LLR-40K-21) TaxID=446470 RepID=D3PUU0_STANL|nr:putative phytochrome sensor protein [Stackebrandtia nassauensis DSM 44728]